MTSTLCSLLFFCILAVATSQATDICEVTVDCMLHNKTSPVKAKCEQMNTVTWKGACCLGSSNEIIGLGLEDCTLTLLTPYRSQLSSVKYLSLNESDVDCSEASNFEGMIQLDVVWLSRNCTQCPGTNAAWSNAGKDVCSGQRDSCSYRPVKCPDNSICRSNGPWFRHCVCDGDFHGYRCLKQGTFPVWPFVGGLVGSTAFTSVVLWYWTLNKTKNVRRS